MTGQALRKTERPTEEMQGTRNSAQDDDASVPFEVAAQGPHPVLLVTISCPILFS